MRSAAADQYGLAPLLEISSKSPVLAGIALSAFDLMLADPSLAFPISIEDAFENSKVFARGGPYVDLYAQSPRDARRDLRPCTYRWRGAAFCAKGWQRLKSTGSS